MNTCPKLFWNRKIRSYYPIQPETNPFIVVIITQSKHKIEFLNY